MTQNQIAFWKLEEDKRANREQERLKGEIQEAQADRWKHQNSTDTANAVTGGIGNILGGLGKIINPVQGVTSQVISSLRNPISLGTGGNANVRVG